MSTDQKNQVAVSPRQKFEKSLNIMQAKIKEALPKHLDIGRFSRIVSTAVGRNPKLLECKEASFFGSLLLAAQLGLEPNGPDQKCFLIPYGSECQFQLGYRGLLDLVRRSGELAGAPHVEVAFEHDEIEIILGLNPTITHIPKIFGDRGKPILVYSVVKFKDGSADFIWMQSGEVEKIKQKQLSKLKDYQIENSPWTTMEFEMWKKVCLKRHTKTLPMSMEIQRAIDSDESIKSNYVSDMTEPQEGETVEEVEATILQEEESNRATDEDRAQFYKDCSTMGLTHLLTMQEKTMVNTGCDKMDLVNLTSELQRRKKAEPRNAAEEAPLNEAPKAEEKKSNLGGMEL